MKIIFFGTPDFVIPVLKLLAENFEVVVVVTAPDKSAGSPIAQYAQKLDTLVLKPLQFNNEVIQQLNSLQPDLLVLAAYGKLLPQNLLDIPKYGALNLHPSLLPKYRGPSPIQAAILSGDQVSGVSIIKMDDKMDHGPVLTAKEISLSEQDTCDTLSKKMFYEGADLLIKIIPDFIAGKIKPKEQNHNLATFTKILKKEDGYFNIDNPPSPEVLDRMIRAFYPWPGVWTKWCQARKTSSCEAKIVKFYPGGLVQMEGKKPTKLEDFLRGHPNFPIKYF